MLNTPRRRRAFNAVVGAVEAVLNGINFKRFYYGKGAATTDQLDLTYKDMVLIDGTIKSYSSDPVNKPVALGEVNTYTHALIKTWNQTWKDNYGDWFILPLRYLNSSLPFTTAFDVLCSDGVVRKIYNAKLGWPGGQAGTTITKDDVLSFWDAAGISPTAGGDNVPGTATAWFNAASQSGTSHFDHTNEIDISLGKSDDPMFTGLPFFKFNFTKPWGLNWVIPATAGIGSIKWLNVYYIWRHTGKFGINDRAMSMGTNAHALIQDVFTNNENKWTVCIRCRSSSLDLRRLISIYNAQNQLVCSLNMDRADASSVSPKMPFYVGGVEKGIKTIGTPRVNLHTWYEVMFVKDGDVLSAYLNGELVATVTSSEHVIPAGSKFVLFGGDYGTTQTGTLQIEMLHIWPGFAATADRAGLVNWMPY